MGLRDAAKNLFRMCGHAMNITVHERLDRLEEQVRQMDDEVQGANFAETHAALLQAAIHITETLHEQTSFTVLESADPGLCNPEIGLMEFLYSYLPSRKVIDVGANVGALSEVLLQAGYEVYAFEPYSPVYAKLIGRLGNQKGFHAYPFAVGARDGEAPLYLAEDHSTNHRHGDSSVYHSLCRHPMPDDLVFKETMMVPVRSLQGLHASGVVPSDIGLAKIAAEGFDLEIIDGMGEHRYPVVLAEFWDKDLSFSQSTVYTIKDLVHRMKERGYCWYLVLYRIWGQPQVAFYANHARPVPNSHGNVVFFKDYSLFVQAQLWCAGTLPRTYFKAHSQGDGDGAEMAELN